MGCSTVLFYVQFIMLKHLFVTLRRVVYLKSRGELDMNTKMMTIGELAKQTNVTVRTLQYYDSIGLLKPSTLTEGGRRLYAISDMVILHQIITLKSVGFSLEDIKERLIPVNGTGDLLLLLDKQKSIIKDQISKSEKLLESIEILAHEIAGAKDGINWFKHANLAKLIDENNEYYWVIKYLDQDILSHIIERHENLEGLEIPQDWLKDSFQKAIRLQTEGKSPACEEAQEIAHDWWQVIMTYSMGDQVLIKKLYQFYKSADQWPKEYRQMQKQVALFMEEAIEVYLTKHQIDIQGFD